MMALYKAAGQTSPARLRKEDRRDVVEEKAGFVDGADADGDFGGSSSG
jgi:hypothetical protein